MAAGNRLRCRHIAIVFFMDLLASRVGAEAQGVDDYVFRAVQQQNVREGGGPELEKDRWTEESERINRLKFEKEGKWRQTEPGDGREFEPSDQEPAGLQRLRKEGEERARAVQLAWQTRAHQIYGKWGSVRESSPTAYVSYSQNNDAFGGVDYEKGMIEAGAVASAPFQDGEARIERLLSERLAFLLQGQSMPGARDLEGQVRMPSTGRLITQEEIGPFCRHMARSGEPAQSYTAPDGIRRLRKQIRIELVPDHLQARVRLYMSHIQKAARMYEVEPQLILAVIETESLFNPQALSSAGAVGLMQLVPTTGALEASKLVYGEAKLLTREELARPDMNIELGAAYLRILLKRHFREYRADPRKRLLVAIAGYNCGPACVKRALEGQDTGGLSHDEFYDLLLRVVPRETQAYLQRVVRNMRQYESIMGKGPSGNLWVAGVLASASLLPERQGFAAFPPYSLPGILPVPAGGWGS
jgi:membrane-bound lytic murein transglycosylase C